MNELTTPTLDQKTGQRQKMPPEHSTSRLSDELQELLVRSGGKSITFGDILEVLRERGHAIVVMLVTFPFVFPIPTLGLSAVAGSVVMALSMCLIFGMEPWLPGKLARREMTYDALQRLVARAQKVLQRMERIFKPRLQFMIWPGMRNLLGIALLSAAFILALPIPVPFANAIPALSILLLTAGFIERDGLFVLLGHIVNLASWAFLYLCWDMVGSTFMLAYQELMEFTYRAGVEAIARVLGI